MNIAIITPIYRHTQHLPRFLGSVRWQLEAGDELIFCCERDEYTALEALLASLGVKPEDNIRLFANKNTPATCASARNEAVSHAGQAIDWLKFLDADDLLAPFALSTFRQMTIEDRMQCVGGAQLKVVNGKVMGLQIPKPQLMDRVNPMVPSMCFVRAAAFAKAGGFDNRIGFEEDWDLWLKLRREYGIEGFGIMPQPLCYYTIDEAERAAKRQPSHLVEDPDSKAAEGAEPKMIDVREYLAKVYGIKPDR